MSTIARRIGGAPISWGVCEAPEWGHELPPERVHLVTVPPKRSMHERRPVPSRVTAASATPPAQSPR